MANAPPPLVKLDRQKWGRVFTSLSAEKGRHYDHKRGFGDTREWEQIAKDPMWHFIMPVIKWNEEKRRPCAHLCAHAWGARYVPRQCALPIGQTVKS